MATVAAILDNGPSMHAQVLVAYQATEKPQLLMELGLLVGVPSTLLACTESH